MQPYFGANPGRERGFAGDFAANSGLVGRIRAAGVPGDPAKKRYAANKRPAQQTSAHATDARAA